MMNETISVVCPGTNESRDERKRRMLVESCQRGERVGVLDLTETQLTDEACICLWRKENEFSNIRNTCNSFNSIIVTVCRCELKKIKVNK